METGGGEDETTITIYTFQARVVYTILGGWDGQDELTLAVTCTWAQECLGPRPSPDFLDLLLILLESPEPGVPYSIQNAVEQSIAVEIMIAVLNLTVQGKTGTPSLRNLKAMAPGGPHGGDGA
eukprot:760940-Rhodomonas_salina.1